MSEINSPAIRFAGFTDAWEQRKLVDIIDDYVERTTIQNQYPVLTSSQQWGIIFQEDYFAGRQATTVDNIGYFVLPRGYFTYRSRSDNNIFVFNRNDLINKGIISYFYPVFRLKDTDSDFFLQRVNNGIQRQITMSAEGTGQHVLSLKKFKNIESLFPTVDEQAQIGAVFNHLDGLITLHQREHDKTVNIKKALLEKMFPKDGEDKPQIRFSGFTEAWKQRKLGELLTEVKRPIKLIDDEEYQLVTVKRRNEGVHPRGILKGKDILVKNYFEIREGDYLISKRQVVHGANGIVPKRLDKAIVSNEYLVSTGNEAISVNFLALLSRHPEMYRIFFLSSYGVDIEKLVFDVEDWKKRSILVPLPDEQNKICALFYTISDLITLHQCELTKLQNIKKALLEKMFV